MTDMTETRVLELIEAYGAESACWPDAERDAAQALLRASPDNFSEALAEARALDAALSAMPEPELPAGLAERIIASAPMAPAASPSGFIAKLKSIFSVGGSIVPSASALASTAFGLVIGYGAIGTTQVADVDTAEEAVYAALDSGYDFDIGEFNQ